MIEAVLADARVVLPAAASARGQGQDLDPCVGLGRSGDDARRVIGAAVVDDDPQIGAPGLPRDRRNRVRDEARLILDRCDDQKAAGADRRRTLRVGFR